MSGNNWRYKDCRNNEKIIQELRGKKKKKKKAIFVNKEKKLFIQ